MPEKPRSASGERPHWRSSLLYYLRPVVGIVLLCVLLSMVPFGSLISEVKHARLGFIVLAFVAVLADMLVSSLKLWLLLRLKPPALSLPAVVNAYYVGSFFNNFLPTNVGGDVMKVAELRRRNVSTGHAAACVVVERGTGILMVMVVAAVVGLWQGEVFDQLDIPAARWLMIALALGTFAAAGAAYALWQGHLKAFLQRRQERVVYGGIYRMVSAFYVFRHHLGVAAVAMGLSAVFYCLLAVTIVILGRSVGAQVPFMTAAVILPPVKIAELLPISLGALGVREVALSFCLVGVGVSPAQAATMALLLRLIVWVHSAAGGCAYVAGHRRMRHAAPVAGKLETED